MTNQLTLLFLVVVISGALCTVEDYVIMSQCAHNKAIYLAAEGTVSVTDISQTQNITIVGRPDFVNNNFKIALYAKETQRYLCFNDHWKLVGMKELQDTCYFNEAIVHGYFVFRSVIESQRRIGFTQRGRAVGPKKTVNDACYMFTKIPTDQFFHQHNHYSSLSEAEAPKSTKTPKSEHGVMHFGRGGGGSGSGGGRLRPNRHRNRNRSDEDGEKAHSNKKNRYHGAGHKKRQHQQRLQQMRGGGSGNGSGSGSGNGNVGSATSSDPKNSSYLNSSRHNVELSQYGGHNHTGKHHNHSQPQAHHQTRHHHAGEARRHHHDARQKTHHRERATSTSPEATSKTTSTTPTTRLTTTITPTPSVTPRASEQTAVTSTKLKLASNSDYGDIKPTISLAESVTNVAASATTLSSRDVISSTVAHKRKGRRRRPHRKHSLHKNDHHTGGGEMDSSHVRHGHSHATLASYDDDEFMTTDFSTWINNEKNSHESRTAERPTSASLPSWETWYPSASSTPVEEGSDYSASSIASYEKTESHLNQEKASSAAMTASASPLKPSLDDTIKQSLTLLPLPLPTSELSTSYTEQKVEEVISPTTERTSTTSAVIATAAATTNTSVFQENVQWLVSHHHEENFFNTTDILDELNITSEADTENATLMATANSDFFEVSESMTESYMDAADATQLPAVVEAKEDKEKNVFISPSIAPTKSTDSHESHEHGAKMMTDYIYATRSTPPATSIHKSSRHRHNAHDATNQKQHQHNNNNGPGGAQRMHHTKKSSSNSSKERDIPTIMSTTTSISSTILENSRQLLESSPTLSNEEALRLDALLTADKNFNAKQSHNTVTDPEASDSVHNLTSFLSSTAVTASLSSSPLPSAATTTRKALRKSTQRLLATPFHQLTYVRNENGDIDIDSLDNISIYPDLLDNEQVNADNGDDDDHKSGPGGTSRFTMISAYLPTSATATLPESIRIAKIKINRERKRMLRLRNVGGYAA